MFQNTKSLINVLDQIKVLLFNLEREKYWGFFEHEIRKTCKHQVNRVHNITIFRREEKAAISCRLPMNYGCGSRPLATFCYNVNFSLFWFSVICIYKGSCQASNPRNVLKIFTWSLKVWTAVEWNWCFLIFKLLFFYCFPHQGTWMFYKHDHSFLWKLTKMKTKHTFLTCACCRVCLATVAKPSQVNDFSSFFPFP